MPNWTKEEQAAHRKELVAALRSGTYQQTTGHLKDEIGFCCLGVACDISNEGAWEINMHGSVLYRLNEGGYGETHVMPYTLESYYGFTTKSGTFTPQVLLAQDGMRFSVSDLWSLNDSLRWHFDQIADFIESEPPGLLAE